MPRAVPRERPILFNAEMVRAVLDGSKTQTRRVVKPQPDFTYTFVEEGALRAEDPNDGQWYTVGCPYGVPGDRLWVRETWRPSHLEPGEAICVEFRAGGEHHWCDDVSVEDADRVEEWEARIFDSVCEELDSKDVKVDEHDRYIDPPPLRWRPSIHMPRWASRILLEVTEVRVERVQDITEADAIAEGARRFDWEKDDGECPDTYREAFWMLWDFINGKRGYGWDENPYVWVVSFRRVEP